MSILETMFDKGALPVLERTLQFGRMRHRVIANNIANVATPHYRAQDLPVDEFQRLLQTSIARQQRQTIPRFRLEHGFDVRAARDGGLEVSRLVFPNTGVLRHDGNNVSIDMEMAKLSRNAILQDTVLQMLRHQFDLISTAISERVVT